jgi:hypothetical protein
MLLHTLGADNNAPPLITNIGYMSPSSFFSSVINNAPPLRSSTLLFSGARWVSADYREYDHLAGAIQTGDERSINPLVRLVRAEEGEEKRRENKREKRT